MFIVFRTDATSQIGTGHFMRCLTLADGLKRNGAHIRFISRELPVHLRAILAAKGIELSSLDIYASAAPPDDLAHAHWLGSSQVQDAEATTRAMQDHSWDWIVVDHYALDARWEGALRATAKKIMVIDDIADRQHDCDVLLDQNFGSRAENYVLLLPSHCLILAGSAYALLRPEFAALRIDSLSRRRQPAMRRVLVAMGGVDELNVTAAVLESLRKSELSEGVEIVVVLGASAPWIESVRHQAKHLKWRTEVLVGVTDMARVMADSDLAVGAVGSTTWERCCLGLPSVLVKLAVNQENSGIHLADAGAALVIDSTEIQSRLTGLINGLIRDVDARKRLAEAASNITDGKGIDRLMEQIVWQ